MSTSKKLIEHRKDLHDNPLVYEYDVQNGMGRLVARLIYHLRQGGHQVITPRKHGSFLEEATTLIFDAQDRRPIFHVEGTELPLCWNAPKNWGLNYIKYEWGHLKSLNQNPGLRIAIRNLALYSARCNQHIQTSMNIEELMVYGGILAQRISNVLTNRRKLFESAKWGEIETSLGIK